MIDYHLRAKWGILNLNLILFIETNFLCKPTRYMVKNHR
jgi:hypothetical protein